MIELISMSLPSPPCRPTSLRAMLSNQQGGVPIQFKKHADNCLLAVELCQFPSSAKIHESLFEWVNAGCAF
jgi:hypothetical protein